MAVADPTLPLLKAVNERLRTTSAVTALVSNYKQFGPAIFDQAPSDAIMPYIAIGPVQVLPELGDCLDGAAVSIQLDAFAANNTPGVAAIVRARQIGAAIAAALDEAEMTLDGGQRLVELTLERTDYLRDPDGITAHAMITIEAHCEPIDPITPPGAGAPMMRFNLVENSQLLAVLDEDL